MFSQINLILTDKTLMGFKRGDMLQAYGFAIFYFSIVNKLTIF